MNQACLEDVSSCEKQLLLLLHIIIIIIITTDTKHYTVCILYLHRFSKILRTKRRKQLPKIGVERNPGRLDDD